MYEQSFSGRARTIVDPIFDIWLGSGKEFMIIKTKYEFKAVGIKQ